MKNFLTDARGPGGGWQATTVAHRMEKQQWAIEKPNLYNARKLRGIYLLIWMTRSSKNPFQTQGNSWNFQWKPLCPVSWRRSGTCSESNEIRKSKHACIVSCHEPTRTRLERTLPKDQEDRIAGKEFNSLSQYNLVHKFIPIIQAMNIWMHKQQWTKSGRSSKNCKHGKRSK